MTCATAALAAALFAPLWLLANRMWIVLAGYLAAVVAVRLGVGWLAGSQSTTLLMIALHLLIGFEADTLRRWTLDRNGWRMVGSVLGRNWAECERRFFDAWLKKVGDNWNTPAGRGGPQAFRVR